ncbi:UDP-N-acetylmuramoyl-L-alanine--D-glutamate ligase [Geotoga petraea]|jgi:UDP-N-acetylmuramoylalanine--D-glutamate ligase|uniref:UDP-N-acetylmuramoylalanine--D-glutamate ligase n=1 Tax=Geotoga petraea TaxID=28234 RepID=A0A1G6NLK8_9BACT|nr:UDP-N-acetylmuramoyl-L-alanine--D-glutamate ligase [Geotoga petraea]MDK2945955.1 UDP-N-acetylmuramoylalanine--D-glutamate ligase [Geotoga sp.]SDC68541.1 UDP-N-acetylmuramoylalanine--D-glutamate ligase [Geotoga petraea]
MKVCLVGFGKSNSALVDIILDKGNSLCISNNNKFSEEEKKFFIRNNIKFEEDHGELLKTTDLAIISPGIRPNSKAAKIIFDNNINYTTELEYSWMHLKRFNPNATFIGVTGTNGKTTTTSLINHIIQISDKSSYKAGNIGIPLINAPLNIDYYVLEVSSFQMYWSKKFSPDIAILLNLAPDHLNWHSDLEEYYNSKLNMGGRTLENYGTFIINSEIDYGCSKNNLIKFSPKYNYKEKKVFYKNEEIMVKNDTLNLAIYRENVVAAVVCLLELNFDKKTIEMGISTFKPLAHRLENFAHINGTYYINDSKATNVHSAYYSYMSFRNKKYIAILSGEPKNEDMSKLIEELNQYAAKVLVFGQMVSEVKKYKLTDKFLFLNNLKEVVEVLKNTESEFVVFSPSGASFDLFKNYEHRGYEFKKSILENIQ